MKVLLSWLRDFAPIDAAIDDIGDHLGDLGTPVEDVTTFDFGGIVVAEVLATRTHPKADKIQLVDVDAGDGEAVQIACGAFNFSAGDLVPLATIGTVMPNGMEIGRRKMRGEWSNGMLCSAAELGLGADHSGIMVLPDGVTTGTEFAEATGLADDVLWDLEVNPNRPDAMSIAGVARDLAARLGEPFAIPTPTERSSGRNTADHASVTILDADLCGRFVARVLRDVPAGDSSLRHQLRLILSGMRPISAAVDVSNLVMLELGVPNHAYDLATVPSGAIRVRRASEGEIITTLDNVERTMAAGDGLICDGDDHPIGMAGVMGGAETEISETTTEILLEAAWWDPPSISRTSRRHGLRSEASARFERGTDPALLDLACRRFAEILGASIDDGVIDEAGHLPWPRRTRVRTERVGVVLGKALTVDEITEQLEPIGFSCTAADGDLDVDVPTWRYDTETEIEIIEEIGRHYGYSKVGKRVPSSPYVGRLTPTQKARHLVRDVLAGLDLFEVMPLPLLGPETHLQAGLVDHEPLSLLNPLTSEESTLRTALLPGMLRALGYNAGHRAGALGVFELGKVFQQGIAGEELPDERDHAGYALGDRDAAAAVRHLRALMRGLGIDRWSLRNVEGLPGLHPTRGAVVVLGDVEIGVVGEVDPAVIDNFDLDGRIGYAELELGPVLAEIREDKPLVAVSTYPSSDIDLAFVVGDDVSAERLGRTLADADELVKTVELFDVYRGDQVAAESRSLAYRLRLQAHDRTLTDDEIGAARQACIDAATGSVGAVLR